MLIAARVDHLGSRSSPPLLTSRVLEDLTATAVVSPVDSGDRPLSSQATLRVTDVDSWWSAVGTQRRGCGRFPAGAFDPRKVPGCPQSCPHPVHGSVKPLSARDLERKMMHAERRQDSAVCMTGASGECTSVPTAVAYTRGQLLDVIVGLPALGEFQPDLLGCMHDGRVVPATECLPDLGQRQVRQLTAQVHGDL